MTWRNRIQISNSGYASAFSRHDLPEICISFSLQRGSRECRMRAAPAVSCANCTSKCAHEHTGQRRTSDIPCAMALRRITRSPRRIRAFVASVASRKPAPRPGRAFSTSARLDANHRGVGSTRFCRTLRHRSSARPGTAHGVYPALQSFSAHDAAASTASHPSVR